MVSKKWCLIENFGLLRNMNKKRHLSNFDGHLKIYKSLGNDMRSFPLEWKIIIHIIK